jgi:hypothetical protein
MGANGAGPTFTYAQVQQLMNQASQHAAQQAQQQAAFFFMQQMGGATLAGGTPGHGGASAAAASYSYGHGATAAPATAGAASGIIYGENMMRMDAAYSGAAAAGSSARGGHPSPPRPREQRQQPYTVEQARLLKLLMRAGAIWLHNQNWRSVQGIDTPFMLLLALLTLWPEPSRSPGGAVLLTEGPEKLRLTDWEKATSALRNRAQLDLPADTYLVNIALDAFATYMRTILRSQNRTLTTVVSVGRLTGAGVHFLCGTGPSPYLPTFWLDGVEEGLRSWERVLAPYMAPEGVSRVRDFTREVERLLQGGSEQLPCAPNSALAEVLLAVSLKAALAANVRLRPPEEVVRWELCHRSLPATVARGESRAATLRGLMDWLTVAEAVFSMVQVDMAGQTWLGVLFGTPSPPDPPFIREEIKEAIKPECMAWLNSRRGAAAQLLTWEDVEQLDLPPQEIRDMLDQALNPERSYRPDLRDSLGPYHPAEDLRGGFGQVAPVRALRADDAALCHNCQKPGHYAAACTEPRHARAGENSGGVPKGVCYNCDKPGHFAAACTAPQRPRGAAGGGGGSRRGSTASSTGRPSGAIICRKCAGTGHKQAGCRLAAAIAAYAGKPCPKHGSGHTTGSCSSPCTITGHKHEVRQCGKGGGAASEGATAAPGPAAGPPATAAVRRVAEGLPSNQQGFPEGYATDSSGTLIEAGSPELLIQIAGLNAGAPGSVPGSAQALIDTGATLSLVRRGALVGAVVTTTSTAPVQLVGSLNCVSGTRAVFYTHVNLAQPTAGSGETGVPPQVQHFGGSLTAMVVEDADWGSLPGSSRFDVLVGMDSHSSWISATVSAALLAQQGTGPPLFTFKARAAWAGTTPLGTSKRPVRVVGQVPYDSGIPADAAFLPHWMRAVTNSDSDDEDELPVLQSVYRPAGGQEVLHENVRDAEPPSGAEQTPVTQAAGKQNLWVQDVWTEDVKAQRRELVGRPRAEPMERPATLAAHSGQGTQKAALDLWANGDAPTREQLETFFWPLTGEMGQRPEVWPRLVDILERHKDVFQPPKPGGPPVDFKVKPGATRIIAGLMREHNPALLGKGFAQVLKLKELGLVQEVDNPDTLEHIHALVLVPKGETVRITGDFREFNKILEGEQRTVLPNIEEHLQNLARGTLFHTVDKTLAFMQQALTEGASNKLGFCLRDASGRMRYFKFLGCPLGPATVPGIYQARQEQDYAPMRAQILAHSILEIFVDNLDWANLPTNTEEELIENALNSIELVLRTTKEMDGYLGPMKCGFFQTELKTLGAVVAHRSVKPNVEDNMAAWKTLLEPPAAPSLKRLQTVVGALNHAGIFVDPGAFNREMGPLLSTLKVAVASERVAAAAGNTGDLRKARDLSAEWPRVQPHISRLVELIVHSKGHRLLDTATLAPTYIIADASDDGLGVGVFQYDPVTGEQYFICTLRMAFTDLQKRWSVGGRELYGLLHGVRRWYRMLACISGPLIIVSDHFNVLTRDELAHAHVTRWVAELQTLLPMVSQTIHIMGAANVLCDEWSRVLPANVPKLVDGWVRRVAHGHASQLTALGKDILLAQGRMADTERRAAEEAGASMAPLQGMGGQGIAGALLIDGRLWVPEDAAIRAKLLSAAHDASLHTHAEAALEILRRAGVHVPHGLERLKEYIKSCPECQLQRMPREPDAGVAPLLLAPRDKPWAKVHMDHFSLPLDDAGNSGMLVLVDGGSRLVKCFVGSTKAEVAVAALRDWRLHYPKPQCIIADGGPTFSGAFAAYCAKEGIDIPEATPYHPRGRGIAERAGKTIKEAVSRILPLGRRLDWAEALPAVVQLLRELPHEGLGGFSPAEVAFVGAPTRRPLIYLGQRVGEDTWGDLINATLALRTLTELASEVQSVKGKSRHDAAMVETKYKVGDTVAVWYPLRETSLDSFWRAPHAILADLDNGFYRHAPLLAGGVTGDASVAHASRLRHYNMDRTSPSLEHQKKLPVGYHVVEEILAGPRAEDGRFQVKWAFVALETWEPAEALRGEAHFIKYCADHSLMPSTGQPFRARTRGGKATTKQVTFS